MEHDHHLMQVVECTIPAHMSIREWRRHRSSSRARAVVWPDLALAALCRVVAKRTPPCDHLHDTTTRYDHGAKRLDFFLVCPVCRTARLIHSVPYEPRFEPMPATVHALHRHRSARPQRPAA